MKLEIIYEAEFSMVTIIISKGFQKVKYNTNLKNISAIVIPYNL